MTEIGESVAVSVPKKEKEKKGDLKVTVVNQCKGTDGQPVEIEDAKVKAGKEKKTTDSSGTAEFTGLKATTYSVYAEKHFEDADYVRFLAHYVFPLGPLTTWTMKAESEGSANVDVPDGGKAEVEVPIKVFRLVDLVEFKRKQIDLGGEDKYGHWWVEIDGSESYGWWPKYPLGHPNNQRSTPPTPPTPPAANAGWRATVAHLAASAYYHAANTLFSIRESSLVQTFRGVEGVLNAPVFGGSATRDPHHGDAADNTYQPVIDDCRKDAEIKDCLRAFAAGYSGGWSWRFEFGKHCHSFQVEMIDNCSLKNFKEK
jgi:hypothetical protein